MCSTVRPVARVGAGGQQRLVVKLQSVQKQWEHRDTSRCCPVPKWQRNNNYNNLRIELLKYTPEGALVPPGWSPSVTEVLEWLWGSYTLLRILSRLLYTSTPPVQRHTWSICFRYIIVPFPNKQTNSIHGIIYLKLLLQRRKENHCRLKKVQKLHEFYLEGD